MVETGLGSDFYRGFHLHRNFAGSTDSCLGTGPAGKVQAPRHCLIRNFRNSDFRHSETGGRCRSADFASHSFAFRPDPGRVLLAAASHRGKNPAGAAFRSRRTRLGAKEHSPALESIRISLRLFVSGAGGCRTSLGAFSRKELCSTSETQRSIDRCASVSSLAVALGRLSAHCWRRLRNTDGSKSEIAVRDSRGRRSGRTICGDSDRAATYRVPLLSGS